MRSAQHAPTRRSTAGTGFTLLELLCVVTILGIISALSIGLLGSWMGGHQHRSAVAATKQAFQRASLLAEAGGGARLWCEGNMLLAEAMSEDLPTMRVSLPADWRVEADDFLLSYDDLTAFDTTGCAANGQYAIIDPQGNRTRVDFLGLTGQIIVYQGVDRW